MKKPIREIEVDEVLPASRATPIGSGEDPLVAFIARLMDTAFTIPGTKVRFGLDPIIGLLPGLGDTAGALVSTLLILQSSRHGVPKIVMARMALNVLINTIFGAVPVAGDLFSVYWKSNARNYALLQRHANEGRAATGRDWLFVIGLITGLLLIVALIIVGAVTMLAKMISTLGGAGS